MVGEFSIIVDLIFAHNSIYLYNHSIYILQIFIFSAFLYQITYIFIYYFSIFSTSKIGYFSHVKFHFLGSPKCALFGQLFQSKAGYFPLLVEGPDIAQI